MGGGKITPLPTQIRVRRHTIDVACGTLFMASDVIGFTATQAMRINNPIVYNNRGNNMVSNLVFGYKKSFLLSNEMAKLL